MCIISLMKTSTRLLTTICLPILSLSLLSCGGGGGSGDSQDNSQDKAPETLLTDKPQPGSGESKATTTDTSSTPEELSGCDVSIAAFDDTMADCTYAVHFTCTAETPGMVAGNITSCTLTVTTPEGATRNIQFSDTGSWYNGIPSTNNLMRDLNFMYYGDSGTENVQIQIIINSMEVISRQNDAQGRLIALDAEIRSAEALIGINAMPGTLFPINITSGTRVRITYH